MSDPFAPPSGEHPPNPWSSPPGPWSPAPWQQTDPYGGWQPPKRTNGLAIAALVTGILAIVPVAVGLALGALRQIRRRDEEGAGLAIGGILASGLWTLFVALIAVIGIKGDFGLFDREGDLADVASQEVGACVNEQPKEVTACSSPHDLEIFYAGTLPERPWPGKDSIDSDADDVCYDSFEDYVGSSPEDSDYGYTFFAPNEEEWTEGRRTVICVITPADSYLVGTVKGSGK